MKSETNIKQIAFLYFEGEVSHEEEKQLYSFIQSSDSNKKQFRQWEQEWEATLIASNVLNKDWEKVQSKLIANTATQTPNRLLNIYKYTAIAASFLLLFFSAYSFLLKKNTTHQSHFIVEAPFGEKSKLTLDDGSQVWLNSGSVLSVEHTMVKSETHVRLNGEAYFEVSKNKDRKFIVKTSAYDVEVLGTKFNISSYPSSEQVITTLIEGSIRVTNEYNSIEIEPGEKAFADTSTSLIQKEQVLNASISNAWLSNSIIYDNISLNDLIIRLSKEYNVKIYLEAEELADKKLSIALRNDETISQIMSALKKILNVEINEYKQNNYIIQSNQ